MKTPTALLLVTGLLACAAQPAPKAVPDEKAVPADAKAVPDEKAVSADAKAVPDAEVVSADPKAVPDEKAVSADEKAVPDAKDVPADPKPVPVDPKSVYGRILTEIGAASCTEDTECQTLPLGYKACGGPAGHAAWSSRTSNPKRLHELGRRLKEEMYAAVVRSRMVSDCGHNSDPGARCAAGRCVLRDAR